DSVVLRDTSGVLLADVPRIDVDFRLPTLLAKSFLFTGVRLVSPRIQLIKHRTTGRMNYEEIFRLGEGKGGGASPLIELQNLQIEDGWLWIQTPWNPDGRLRTELERDSAAAAERNRPGRRIEAGPEGLDRIRVIDQLTARFDTVRLSSPDRHPLRAVVDTLAARVSDPSVTLRDVKGAIVQGGDSLLFNVSRVQMPGTVARGGGRLDWPRDT